MPMMKPPEGFNGVSYNSEKVPPGCAVNVLPADVAAHEAQGWTHSGSSTLAASAVIVNVTTEQED